MVLVPGNQDSEAGVLPSKELLRDLVAPRLNLRSPRGLRREVDTLQRPRDVMATCATRRQLLDNDLRAVTARLGQVLNPAVDHCANGFEEFDARIPQVLSYFRRHTKGLPHLLHDLPAEAALLHDRLGCILPVRFLLAHCTSLISTVRIRCSSRARAGIKAAIDRGSPI